MLFFEFGVDAVVVTGQDAVPQNGIWTFGSLLFIVSAADILLLLIILPFHSEFNNNLIIYDKINTKSTNREFEKSLFDDHHSSFAQGDDWGQPLQI